MSRNESVLFRTSDNTAVNCSGDVISIAGLQNTIRKNRVTSFKQLKYRTEVTQVYTLTTGTSFLPANLTTYAIELGDTNRIVNGAQELLKKYVYQTSATFTTVYNTAALQREAINAALVTLINADTRNYVTAASLGGGTGITITDNAGYYPVYKLGGNNRLGATTVYVCTNPDGSGFTSSQLAITTNAVYSFGIGADLASMVPVKDPMYGGLLSGVLETLGGIAPTTKSTTASLNNLPAVVNQNYDGFIITHYAVAQAYGGTRNSQFNFLECITSAVVDNGTGSATTNLAGFLTFEREMHKLMFSFYQNDDSAVVEFFDKNFIEQGPLGVVPTGNANAIDKFITPYGLLNRVNIGTQTIVTPTQGTTGLLFEQDTTATKGAEYSPDLCTLNNQQIVVGKTAGFVLAKTTFTTGANIVFMAGFRTKGAYNAAFGSYTNLATIGTGAAGAAIATYGTLAAAANVATTSATNTTDGAETTWAVYVDINGNVTCWANGVKYPVYSAGTTPLVFTAGTILVPFFQYTNLNSSAAAPTIREFVGINSDQVFLIS
jgi:hypothetical protein